LRRRQAKAPSPTPSNEIVAGSGTGARTTTDKALISAAPEAAAETSIPATTEIALAEANEAELDVVPPPHAELSQ
jgi:hypothetical protein